MYELILKNENGTTYDTITDKEARAITRYLIKGGPMKERIEKLLTVKSIVTILLTIIFSVLAVRGDISGTEFLTVFTVVISFYFGVQHEKKNQEEKNGNTEV